MVTVFLSTYLILLSRLGTAGFIIARSVYNSNSNSIYVREIMEK